jgi:hypothetical protein
MTTEPPFKITKLGFYKMRDGKKCEVVHIHGQKAMALIGDIYNEYYEHGSSRVCRAFDIISKWKEPRVIEIPECASFIHVESGRVFVCSGEDLKAAREADKSIEIKIYPACTVKLED